jgi:hypothetical protein
MREQRLHLRVRAAEDEIAADAAATVDAAEIGIVDVVEIATVAEIAGIVETAETAVAGIEIERPENRRILLRKAQ